MQISFIIPTLNEETIVGTTLQSLQSPRGRGHEVIVADGNSKDVMEDIAICRALKRFARPYCLRVRAVTSFRRWEQRGILRTMILMWFLRLAYALGVSAQRLAGFYN